ncbi:MAG: sodium/solute symporter [Clostridia bacterium]|nr:sodium/solute symporter [Clostridia bacterium]
MKYLFVCIYIVILIGIGIISKRKTNTLNDFFLGGRSIGPWISAFSYGTAYFSAVLFIGYAGKTGWGFGLSSLWIVLGNAVIGCYLAWKVLGKRTREITNRINVSTMPEFLEKRYDSKMLKLVTAVIIFAFLIPYSASVYMGLSYLFEHIFNIPYTTSMFIMALLTAFYLLMGGYIASTLTDFVQAFIMIIGVVFLLFYIITSPNVGGFSSGIAKLSQIDHKLIEPVGPPGFLSIFSLVLMTSLGSWGLPQMVHKFYTIKDETFIKKATIVSTAFAFLITFGAYFTGSFSRLFFDNELPVNPDIIMPKIISTALPDAVSGIILLLVLSASMSTLASIVLASSSAIAIDLVKGIIFPDMAEKKVMNLMRILCGVFVALSFVIAMLPNVIITLSGISFGAVAGSLLAPYLMGLYWKGITKAGAWASVITGLFSAVAGALYVRMDPSLIPITSSIAMIVPIVIAFLVSKFTQPYPESHILYIFPRDIYGEHLKDKSSQSVDGRVVMDKFI